MKIVKVRSSHVVLLSKILLVLSAAVVTIIIGTHLSLLKNSNSAVISLLNTTYRSSYNSALPMIMHRRSAPTTVNVTKPTNVVIGAVICRTPTDYGPREETSVLMKSIIISALLYKNVSMVTFHLFIEYLEDKEYFVAKVHEFGYSQSQRRKNPKVVLKFHSVVDTIPPEHHTKMVYSPIRCAYIRCFFPIILGEVDSILYLDTDVIVTGSIADIWSHLEQMDGEQLIGAVMDFEPENNNFQRIHDGAFGDIPIPTPKGLNSGVLLMNLTRMRDNKWVEKALQLWHDYGAIKSLEDQRLINILLFYDSGLLHLLPCHYNFRPLACIKGMYCSAAKTDPFGIHAVHQWHDPRWVDVDTWNAFWEIARVYQRVDLTDSTLNLVKVLMKPIRNAYTYKQGASINAELHGQCNGVLNDILFKNFFNA